jgi:hypothetical protein
MAICRSQNGDIESILLGSVSLLWGFNSNVTRHPVRGILTAILKDAVFWDDKLPLVSLHTFGDVVVFWGNPSVWVR